MTSLINYVNIYEKNLDLDFGGLNRYTYPIIHLKLITIQKIRLKTS